jgi:hypothetical protein
MKTTALPANMATSYTESGSRTSLFSAFITWCKGQEESRLLWLGIILAAHGCVLTPITLMAVLLAGTSMTLFISALVAMAIALVTNLAAMPTKVTIPAFVLSVIIDVVVIALALAHGFDISSTYI